VIVRPVTPVIGAEVSGIDLRDELSFEVTKAIRAALLDRQVLFFRDQPLSPRQQLRFAEAISPVMMPVIDTEATNEPGVTVLDQTAPKGQYTDRWHADSTFLAEPPLGAVLRAVQLPPVGGDTCWASMTAAYQALSPAMRNFLDGLHAEHSTEILDAALSRLGNVVRRDQAKAPWVHPVVRVHPETLRRSLFVNGNFTTRIVELSAPESRALLDLLFRHIDSPEFAVRFRWEVGSVALWDNRCTQHCAISDYDQRRVMYRCMMQGDRPFGPGAPD